MRVSVRCPPRRFSEAFESFKVRLRQQSIDSTLSPLKTRASQAEAELAVAREEAERARNAGAPTRTHAQSRTHARTHSHATTNTRARV